MENKEKTVGELELENLNFNRVWRFPTPHINKVKEVTQQQFINEYYPSGHKIYDRSIFPDKIIQIEEKVKGKVVTTVKTIEVKRVALAIQSLSIDTIVPHLLGNDIIHKQVIINKKDKDEESITLYKKLWEYKNIHHKLWEFIEHNLICGESAIYFYFDEDKKLKTSVLSYLNGDMLCPKFDSYGKLLTIYRKYKTFNENGDEVTYTDKITSDSVTTYDENNQYKSSSTHPFPFIPVIFHRRRDGAFWSKVQSSIDSLEWNMSALSEDNKTKTKGKYHVKASNPKQVQSTTIGGSDVIVTDINGDFKFIEPSNLSEAFKYEYETLKENIFDPLGIIFLKMKASGDMPTGSMKLLFYPSERVCKQLTKEYSDCVQQLSDIFKKGIAMEYASLNINNPNFIIQSNIQVFVPSDDIATLTATADALSKGAMTYESIVRANPKYLDATDIELKKKENEEKAKLQNIEKTAQEEVQKEVIKEEEPKEETPTK